MRRHPATTVYLALTGIFALVALLQPFTFGLGYFGATDSYDLHEVLGVGVLHGIALLALIAALVSPDRRRDAPRALALFVLVSVQIFLPETRDDAAALAAVHPLLGIFLIGLALDMHRVARRRPDTPAAA
jgi:predicted acyltransferase